MKKRFLRLTCMTLLFAMLISNVAFAKMAPAVVTDQKVLSYEYWNTSLSYEERAADLVSHMTLEEKVSQLNSHPGKAIPRLGVAEYWYPGEALNGIANISMWYGTDASDAKAAASTFPSDLGQGSTWNTDLIGQMADAIADEARTYYNVSKKGLTHWAPSMNLSRDPRWGRSDEPFAEDALLSGTMGTAFVRGFQGDFDDSSNYLKAIADVKHFAANNAEYTRAGGSSDMTETELHDYYLRNFEILEKNSDPASYMAGYNAINDMPNHSNYDLLTNILRKTWGFDGFVISDHGGVNNLYKSYGTAGVNSSQEKINSGYSGGGTYGVSLPVMDGGNEDYNGLYNVKVSNTTEAAIVALESGVDIELQAGPAAMKSTLAESVKLGLIDESKIDEALLRLFTPRFATGEFDLGATDYTGAEYQSEIAQILKHKDLAEEVANQSIVLLENNGILPLKSNNYEHVLVVGEYADTMMYTGYKSTDTEWKKANVDVTIYQGIKNYFAEANPNADVSLSTLKDTNGDGKLDLELDMVQAFNAASDKTLVIFVGSMINAALTGGGDTGEANDRKTLTAPRGQLDVAKYLIGLNQNTIVFLNTSSIVDLDEIQDVNGDFTGAALLWSTYLGQAQGSAVANVLSGKISPSGRLSTTWYADESQLGELQHDYSIYADKGTGDYGRTYMYFTGDVDYPFGYGLSYADFDYSNFNISSNFVTGDDTISATVNVTNTTTGSALNVMNTTTGSALEVVQAYVSGPNAAQANRPMRQLVGFDKLNIGAGQTSPSAIDINISDLAYWDETTDSFKMDLGTYTIYLGSDSGTPIANCSTTFEVTADMTPKVYAVTLSADGYIAKAIGEKIETTTSVSMTNNKLYETKADLPTGINLSYKSSDETVATVDGNGTITAVAQGVCTITAYADYNNKTISDSHPIIVNTAVTNVTGVSLDKNTTSVGVGSTTTLTATVSPEGSTDKSVTWSSDNQSVASVNQNGTVTGVAAGTAIITATTNDGSYKATCQVTVTSPYISGGSGSSGGSSSNTGSTPTPVPNDKPAEVKVSTPVLNSLTGEAVASVTGNAVSQAFTSASAGSNGIKTVTLNIPAITGATSYVLQVPAGTLASGKSTDVIQIVTAIGTIIVPSNMLSRSGVDVNKNIELVINRSNASKLDEDVKARIGDRPVIDIYLRSNTAAISWSNPDAPVKVSIPYKPAENEDLEKVAVWYIDDNGDYVPVSNGRYSSTTGMVTFTTTHFSKYAVAYVDISFEDLTGYNWAKRQIEVLAAKGITNGTSATRQLYSPAANITRADYITLLVKTLGLTAEVNGNFTDVKEGKYYYKAVGIAKELGITSGKGNNMFNPEEAITRQDMMTLTASALKSVNKLQAEGTASDLNKFKDASKVASYAVESVAHLVKDGLLVGSDNKIMPTQNTTRAEVAALMYKIYNK